MRKYPCFCAQSVRPASDLPLPFPLGRLSLGSCVLVQRYAVRCGECGWVAVCVRVCSAMHALMLVSTGKRDDECLGKSIHMHAVICGISACHLSVSELVSETVRGQALWACRCCRAPAVVSRVNTLHTALSTPDKSIAGGWFCPSWS